MTTIATKPVASDFKLDMNALGYRFKFKGEDCFLYSTRNGGVDSDAVKNLALKMDATLAEFEQLKLDILDYELSKRCFNFDNVSYKIANSTVLWMLIDGLKKYGNREERKSS